MYEREFHLFCFAFPWIIDSLFPVTHPTECAVNYLGRALLIPLFSQEDDVIVEESSLSASEGEIDGDGSEDDIRELRARRHALTHKLAQQQKRRDKIQVSQDAAIFIHIVYF